MAFTESLPADFSVEPIVTDSINLALSSHHLYFILIISSTVFKIEKLRDPFSLSVTLNIKVINSPDELLSIRSLLYPPIRTSPSAMTFQPTSWKSFRRLDFSTVTNSRDPEEKATSNPNAERLKGPSMNIGTAISSSPIVS